MANPETSDRETDEDDRSLERRIVKALKARRGRATMEDVVVATGMANLEVERMLRGMIGDYDCHLDVTEDGDILYTFDPAMRRRDRRDRFDLWMQKNGVRLWALFSKCMKALIAVVMVVYFLLFVCLIIAAMVASARGNNESSRRSRFPGSSGHGGGSFWFWYFVFGRRSGSYRRRGWRNPAYSRFGGRAGKNKDDRPFYMKVFSFVLGPEPGDIVAVHDHAALLAFVRKKRGVVTTAEIATRTGWSLKRSERSLTKMIARFEGNIVVTENGNLVFTFPGILKTAGANGGEKAPREFWSQWERSLPLTGNSKGANIGIGCLNGFNLVAAAAAPSMILPPLEMAPSFPIMFALHWFPMIFSGVVFAIPVARKYLRVDRENHLRRERNLRRAAYRHIFKLGTHDERAVLEPVAAVEIAFADIPGHAYAGGANEHDAVSALERSMFDLDIESAIDEESGKVIYRLAPLAEAFKEAKVVRKTIKTQDLSQLEMVFSTASSDEIPDSDEPDEKRALELAIEEMASGSRTLH